jgi:hypothetical protein
MTEISKKLTFEDLQPHVDMLCDALENKGASVSGTCYNPEVYTYAEKYREILKQVRAKEIGYTNLWIALRQLERDTTAAAKTQRHRIAKIVNALALYIKKEYNRVNN